MRDNICTIPVSEVFEVNDGCPICRMYETVEKRIINYIMGDAMMEPDVRIATNRSGFCEKHLDKMLTNRGRLQLSLMLQTHIDEINKTVFSNKLFSSPSKKGEKAAKISEACFICDKIEFGISHMIATIYRTYEEQSDFRKEFNAQTQFCLPHYERLISGFDKRNMRNYGRDFAQNLTRITGDYLKNLYADISEFCSVYDYRFSGEKKLSDGARDSVENAVNFLIGRTKG